MNASSIFTLLAFFFLLSSPAIAQDPSAADQPEDAFANTAPALYELKEVLVEYPVFVDPRTANDCGLMREALLTTLQRNLQDPGLEVMMVNETHPRVGARVNLTVEIGTVKQDKTCWSWIDFPLTDKAPIMLPPVKVPRTMTLTFWHQRKLATSSVESHQSAVNDMLATLSRQFLRDVKLALPGAFTPDGKRADSEEDKREQLLKSLNDSVSKRLIQQQGVTIP
ncbi:MAG: hypothetical protein WDO70_06280 [Alphaproteobacteria bacterium]